MELKIESRIGTVHREAGQIYDLLSDFSHLASFVPPDKVQDWSVTTDTCSFSVQPVGKITFRMVNREPQHTLKMAVDTTFAQDVFLWTQLKPVLPYETKVKLTVKAEVNPMMKMFVAKPLQQLLDRVVEALERM